MEKCDQNDGFTVRTLAINGELFDVFVTNSPTKNGIHTI